MKKVLFIAMSLFLSIAYGQEKENLFSVPKKTWYINGSVSFSSQSVESSFQGETREEPKTSTFNFSPNIGFTVNDNLILGLGFNYASTSIEI